MEYTEINKEVFLEVEIADELNPITIWAAENFINISFDELEQIYLTAKKQLKR